MIILLTRIVVRFPVTIDLVEVISTTAILILVDIIELAILQMNITTAIVKRFENNNGGVRSMYSILKD